MEVDSGMPLLQEAGVATELVLSSDQLGSPDESPTGVDAPTVVNNGMKRKASVVVDSSGQADNADVAAEGAEERPASWEEDDEDAVSVVSDDLSSEEEVDREDEDPVVKEEEVDGDASDAEIGLGNVQGVDAAALRRARTEQARLSKVTHMRRLVATEESYSGDWSGAPAVGTDGFNEFATSVIFAAGVGAKRKEQAEAPPCRPLQPHQEVVGFLLHPRSPVTRLLVDHPVGSGKTREMITVLDNFFNDPRPKVPIFPKQPVCVNFYAELLRWPNRYREFFACLRPQDAARACGSGDWRSKRAEYWPGLDSGLLDSAEVRSVCTSVREVLEMKNWFHMGGMRTSILEAFRRRFPDEPLPAAPLRALRYTSAGGSHTAIGEDGLPVSALLKIGFGEDGNVYSQKIVIMDETHNLVRTQTQYGEQLSKLRELLFSAKGMVLAGFTGTPILSEASEGRMLLDIIKGQGAPPGDEGYISSFHMRPEGLFPRPQPVGVPDSVLTPKLRRQLTQNVDLVDESLMRYEVKRAKGIQERKLRSYCNMSIFCSSFHGGKHGQKARILAEMATLAPKLDAIVKAVASCPEKAIVLVARSSGLMALIAHMRQVSEASVPAFGVATMDELEGFNSAANRRGELFRVLIADASQCSEGVNFLAVRQAHIADVPVVPSAFVQAVGRTIRMFGHKGLPEEEQTVRANLYVARMPRWMRSPLSGWALRATKRCEDWQETQSNAKRLLRRLLRVGIRDIEDLKARLDAHGERHLQVTPEKAPLSPEEAGAFLEQIGLWDEAKAIKSKQRRQRRKLTRRPTAAADTPRKTPLQSPKVAPPPLAGGPSSPEKLAKATAAGTASAEKGAAKGEKEVRKSALIGVPKDYFLSALNALYVASSVDAAIEALCIAPRSADEDAIRQLAARSRTYVPALAELRAKAIDRVVFERLCGQQLDAKNDESEGESSACEFVLSDDDGADETEARLKSLQQPSAENPLVLPADWRIEYVDRYKDNRQFREFVDPAGKRYASVQLARQAIDSLRRSENVAASLKAKFAQILAKRG